MDQSGELATVNRAAITPALLRARRILARCAVITVMLTIALSAALAGLHLRKAAFINTDGSHFRGDVSNAFRWGNAAGLEGLFNLYDRVQNDVDGGTRISLDYPPFRLTAAYLWVQWIHRHYPDATKWQDDYDFTRSMLMANTIAEAISSLLVFLLIYLWTVRMYRGRAGASAPRPFFLGVVPGLFGALLFWFNPAVVWDGHCWPQWDVWLIPFFLAAILFASLDWWFFAGICIVIGASFKGQMLLGAPVLIVWPILAWRWRAVIQIISGFLFAAAAIALPWMKLDERAMIWVISVVIALIIVSPLVFRIHWPAPRLLVAAGIALIIAWHWGSHAAISLRRIAPVIVALAVLDRYVPRRNALALYISIIAIVVFLTIPLFNADSAWFNVGYKFGTQKFETMITGSGAWNIAKMQQVYFNAFERPDDPLTIPFTSTIVTYRTAASLFYGVCVLLSSAGAAWHARRRRPDTRFLTAMVAPWLCFFMILAQMHGRYLIWAAGLSALLAGVSVGMALLGVIVSAIGWLGMVENQYLFVPQYDPDTLQTLQKLDPHLGWALLIIMAIYLYVAATPRRRLQ